MDIGILEILLVWLTIGVVIGGWISVDTFRRKVEGARWVAAGVFLTVIGLGLYLYMRKKANAVKQPEFRPSAEYDYAKTVEPEALPAPIVEKKEERSSTIPPTLEQVQPNPETQVFQPVAPAVTKMEKDSQYHSWAPVIKIRSEAYPAARSAGPLQAASMCSVRSAAPGSRESNTFYQDRTISMR